MHTLDKLGAEKGQRSTGMNRDDWLLEMAFQRLLQQKKARKFILEKEALTGAATNLTLNEDGLTDSPIGLEKNKNASRLVELDTVCGIDKGEYFTLLKWFY